MTRINCGIPPVALSDWHLVAEINELPRIVGLYLDRKEKGVNFGDIPKKFTLNSGHMKFFLDKGLYLNKRYDQLLEEIKKRSPAYKDAYNRLPDAIFEVFKNEHYQDYEPTKDNKETVVGRIIERIKESDKLPYYYARKETKMSAIERLTQVATPKSIAVQVNMFK